MSSFTFKQFHIKQQHCAMKVGADGILLGCWVDIAQVKNVLDMGSGTDLLALMFAQRSSPDCLISGVELDPARRPTSTREYCPFPLAGTY